MSNRNTLRTAIGLTTAVCLAAAVAAQPTRTPGYPPPAEERLATEVQAMRTEVQAIRREIGEVVSASLRTQLLLARLQLQQQRLAQAGADLAVTRHLLGSREDSRPSVEVLRGTEAAQVAALAEEERRWTALRTSLDDIERRMPR